MLTEAGDELQGIIAAEQMLFMEEDDLLLLEEAKILLAEGSEQGGEDGVSDSKGDDARRLDLDDPSFFPPLRAEEVNKKRLSPRSVNAAVGARSPLSHTDELQEREQQETKRQNVRQQDDRASGLLATAPNSGHSEQHMQKTVAMAHPAGDEAAASSGKIQVSINDPHHAPTHF